MSDSSTSSAAADVDQQDEIQQHMVVMRHGDRIDNAEPMWIATAVRPWDPPLTESGIVRAFCTGRKLRKNLKFPIQRVFVSPFLRCIQTASEVVSALCATNDDSIEMTAENISIDPSKLKVSIEYGLCEVLSRQAIGIDLIPKDGGWGFDISELQAMLPAGTVDQSVTRVYEELPLWEESVSEARARYYRVIHTLADRYPKENLLFVTHGEGVGIAVSSVLKDTTVYEVAYCAYSHSQRRISFSSDGSFTAGDFEKETRQDQSGISYC